MRRKPRKLFGHGVLTMSFALLGMAGSAGAQTSSNDRILGFEQTSVTDWQVIWNGPGTLSVSTTASQGSRSLAVLARGYVAVESAPLTSLGYSVGNIIRYDIRLPDNLPSVSPYWYGDTQMFVDSPSLDIHNQYIGYADLTGMPVGAWQTITFTPPPDLMTKLRGSYADLRFIIVVNSPFNASQPYLVDNLRFSDTAAPTFSPPEGMYPTTQNVTLSCPTPGASAFYTTNGSTPNTSSTPYTSPIVVSSTTTIKAICSGSGGSSPVASATYTIGVDLRPEITRRGIPLRSQLSTGYCVLFAMTFLQEYLLADALGTSYNWISVDYALQAANVASGETGATSSFPSFSKGYNTYGAVTDPTWHFTGATYNYATWNATFTPLISTGQVLLSTGSRLAGKCLREGGMGPLTTAQLDEAIGYLIRGIPVAIAWGGHARDIIAFERNTSEAGGGHVVLRDSGTNPGSWDTRTFQDLFDPSKNIALYAYEWAPTFPVAYEGTNYTGYNYALAVGDYVLHNLTDMGASNDAITSIRVPAGYTVRLYQDDNFGEPHVDITGDVSDLSILGFDHRASSIRILH